MLNMKDLLKKAKKDGWTVTDTKNGHFRLVPAHGGPIVIAPKTPRNEWRSVKNVQGYMRESDKAAAGQQAHRKVALG